jgi:hypothetical protein
MWMRILHLRWSLLLRMLSHEVLVPVRGKDMSWLRHPRVPMRVATRQRSRFPSMELGFLGYFVFAEQRCGRCNSLVGELEPVALHLGVGALLKARGQIIVPILRHIRFSIYDSLGDLSRRRD